MYRTALNTLVILSCISTSLSLASNAEAGPPRDHARRGLMISTDYGVRDLYPKTLKNYYRGKARLKKLAAAYYNAVRRGDRKAAARYERKHRAVGIKAQKRLQKLKSVRPTRVVVWGEAMDKMPPKKIAALLRKKRKWQGGTVHIYGVNGNPKIGRRRPAKFDRRQRDKRPSKQAKKPARGSGGMTPIPYNVPTGSGGTVPTYNGLYGVPFK